MLTVNLIAIGKLKEQFWRDGLEEYSKRLGSYCKFNVIELSEHKASDNPTEKEIAQILEAEGKDILAKAGRGYLIAMCVEGKGMSSEALAQKLTQVSLSSSTVNFVIGGSFGLSDAVKSAADLKLSVSDMTFPHQMFRVILAEQIYRAFAIIKKTKYHK